MLMEDYKKVIRALETLFPSLRGGRLELKEEALSSFPFWLRSASTVHTLQIPGEDATLQRLTLIHPKAELSFDQLLNVYRQVEQKTGPHTLLVADDINPKHRPLLVRSGIQFVYRDESIFAPNLAMMFKKLKAYKQRDLKGEIIKRQLHPLSLKLLSAHLTRQLPRELGLQNLQDQLKKNGAKISLSKLSSVMNELVQFGMTTISGSGPKKKFVFPEPSAIWTLLSEGTVSPFMKTIELSHFKKSGTDYVLAGESALAEYSDLASPKTLTVAMTMEEYRKLSTSVGAGKTLAQSGACIQVWKENPKVFSIKGKLNPVELYFSMREHSDERVQLALKTMLAEYNLAPMEGK